jgi:hypothetical protein
VCEGGVDLQQSPVQLQCPLTPPRGLQVSLRGEAVAVRPGEDVLFVVRQEQVSGPRLPPDTAAPLMHGGRGHLHSGQLPQRAGGTVAGSQPPGS